MEGLDFRWTTPPAAPEPVAGMSESLAEGLVTRFVTKWRSADAYYSQRRPQPQTTKRAAAFRQYREWLVQSIPSEHLVLQVAAGDQSGKDKKASFAVVYWAVPDIRPVVCAAFNRLDARGGSRGGLLFILTRHALVRLFQRLKTTDDTTVLYEAATGVKRFFPWLPLHRLALKNPEILVPTERGALIIGPNDNPEDCPRVAKTWMSDARMSDTLRRMDAVLAAREENGFVLCVNGHFVVVSIARLEKHGSDAVLDYVRASLPPSHKTYSHARLT